MKTCRVHITGASGAGVTSLGHALAHALAVSLHDTDDYYWLPTNPPYERTRPIPDRLRPMREMFLDRADWVLSGALESWGAPILPHVDLVVFLYTPTEERLRRLRQREAGRFGAEAVAPGGWRHAVMEEFVAWAGHYDAGTSTGRSLPRHEAFLAELDCPALRLDGLRPAAQLVADIRAVLGR